MDNQANQAGKDKEVKVGKYLIKVLRDTCIGAASCLAVSPATFELDGEHKATVKGDSDDVVDNIILAAQACPTKAIVITDTETGSKFGPHSFSTMNPISNLNKGIYFAFITALISGVAIFVNKFAVTAIQPPVVFTAVKNAGVGILILAIVLAWSKWKLVKKLNRREIFYLVLIGIIGGSIPFYLFFTGLSQVPAVNAAIIQKTLVVWVAIAAIPLLKEKMSFLQIFGVILLFGANLLVGGFAGFTFVDGEFFILVATVLWSVEIILAKKILPTVDPDILTAARMGFGSIILLIAAAITAPKGLVSVLSLSSTQIFWMSISIVTLLGYVMTWYRALRYAPATTVTSVLVAATLVTNVLSAIFVTHAWTTLMGIQAVLMIIGVGMFWVAARKEAGSKSENLAFRDSS